MSILSLPAVIGHRRYNAFCTSVQIMNTAIGLSLTTCQIISPLVMFQQVLPAHTSLMVECKLAKLNMLVLVGAG